MKRIFLSLQICTVVFGSFAQDTSVQPVRPRTFLAADAPSTAPEQFLRAASLTDAAVNSLNALNAIIKKEHYRTRIASLNNPASSDLGFNLELEIQSALKPILAKTKNTSPTRFNELVRSFMSAPIKGGAGKGVFQTSMLYQTLFSLVGTVALGERRVMKEDVDSFLLTVSKYFVPYEKLDRANETFDRHMLLLNAKMEELHFDLQEHMLDLVCLLHRDADRRNIRTQSFEVLQLQYLDPVHIQEFLRNNARERGFETSFPPDALKAAKEIAYGIQKLFNEYQKMYDDNYKEISAILLQSRSLARNINVRQIDDSLRDLDRLYKEGKGADAMALRLNTLFDRLNALVAAGQLAHRP